MTYLQRTTLIELAEMVNEMELNDRIVFTTEDPDELEYYNLNPCKYNLICKSKLLYEEDYVIVVGLMDGHCTIAKDIHILTNGNVDDEDARIEGIEMLLEEYYEKYMEKNKNDFIYLIITL